MNPENAHKTLLLPAYDWDVDMRVNKEEKEKKPPSTIYMTLGFDRDETLTVRKDNQLKANEENLVKQLKKRTSLASLGYSASKITANTKGPPTNQTFDQSSLLKQDDSKKELSDSGSSDEIEDDKQMINTK
jgi:hypothetical protein